MSGWGRPNVSLNPLQRVKRLGGSNIEQHREIVAALEYVNDRIWNKNKIINGAMRIDQRDSDTTPVTAGAGWTYGPDRWALTLSTTGATATIERSSATPPEGFDYFTRCTVGTGATSGAGEYCVVRQAIEGNNIVDLGYGKSWAKKQTVSFLVRSTLAGTYCVGIMNSALNRHFIVEFTLVANTWTPIEFTLPADNAGTWLLTNGVGLELRFDLGSGSNFENTPNVWAAGSEFLTSNQANWIGTSGATFDFTGVQLEVGSVATAFEHRLYGEELALCLRYGWLAVDGDDVDLGVAQAFGTTTTFGLSLFPPVPMRAVPSIEGVTASHYEIFEGATSRECTNANLGYSTTFSNTTRLSLEPTSTAASFGLGDAVGCRSKNASASMFFSAEL